MFLRNRAVIIAYHSIGENASPWTVTPEKFAQHMALLKRKKFNVISLDMLAAYRKAGTIPPKTVVITFDDGYRDNYTTAFPILKQYGFPATIFLTTADIGGIRDLHGIKFEILSQDELRALHDSGLITLAAHTVTHPKFTKVDSETMEREVRDSREFVERITGVPCLHFAYPHGRHSPAAYEAVKRGGARYAYTTEHGFVAPKSFDYALNRNVIASTASLFGFGIIARYGILSLHRLKLLFGL